MAQGPLAVVIAIDTNVLVRVAVADNTAQTQRVGKLFAENDIWVSKTVLLEAEWVLRGTYRLTAPAILRALRTVTAFTNVHVEDPVAVDAALALFAGGLEFADAMHLASSSQCDQLASFDKNFQRNARRHRVLPAVIEP